jgi:hypothetical protein
LAKEAELARAEPLKREAKEADEAYAWLKKNPILQIIQRQQ